MTTPEQLQQWLQEVEAEHFEFKAARNSYGFDDLGKYCCALANEGGGKFFLGITNSIPRTIIGTAAFGNMNNLKNALFNDLKLRVEIEEIFPENKRVLIFHCPARYQGIPVVFKGIAYMRIGDSLRPMSPDCYRKIFAESEPDFSAQICSEATINSLHSQATQLLRERWFKKSQNELVRTCPDDRLLSDAELLIDGQITYAALILLGTHSALGRFLGQSEIIFEYRSSESSIEYQERREFREGFFNIDDDLWELINRRNEIQQYQDGLFKWDISTFKESVVREALLNAVSHRDYQLGGSIFVRQYPRKLEIVSPGGFPPGITAENILYRQAPRNRRVTEVLAKCGLVERSGQGADIMYRETIKEGKPLPDYSGTDDYQVLLTLSGSVEDPAFIRYLERVGQETLRTFSIDDFLLIDHIRHGRHLPENLKSRLPALRHLGLVEVYGRGRGVQYLLSRKFYESISDKASYTRHKGLDRKTRKELLLDHLRDFGKNGIKLGELCKVLPHLSYPQVRSLLQELKNESKIEVIGRNRGARWFLRAKE